MPSTIWAREHKQLAHGHSLDPMHGPGSHVLTPYMGDHILQPTSGEHTLLVANVSQL